MQRITYADAPTAAGKTRGLAERATKLSMNGHRVVIASPTQELCDKTNSDELRNHIKRPQTYVIHSGAVGEGQVQKALIRHFKDRPEGGHITLITHAALTQLPSWLDVGDVHLIVDEELSVVKHTRHRIPQTHHILTDQIEVEPYTAVYGKIGLVDRSVTETLARNEQGDELLAKIREILWTLLNEYSETFVNLEQLAKLTSGDYQMLNFHSLLLPFVVDRFASVFMVAANFESTPIFKIWSDNGVTFERDETFTNSLRYKNHKNGTSLDIYYFHECNWSKRLARKAKRPNSEQTVLDAMLEHSYGMLGEQPFLVHVNKGTSLPTNANAVELPSKPHGSMTCH